MTQQDKIRLIDSLCELCKVASEQLAQAVGQPQWIIDAVLQGKVTNDVTVDAIVGRLLQIYRKKLGCELEDAEKGALVSKEQMKRWESGKIIDYEKVDRYIDFLANYTRCSKEVPAPSGKVFTQSNVEKKTVQVVDKSKKKSKSGKVIIKGINKAKLSVEKQKEKKNKKSNLGGIRKRALGIMAGTIQLPEPPKLYPEPSFLRAVYEKYEREKNIKIIKSSKDIPNHDMHNRYGRLIWNMMQYIASHINNSMLITELANKGFDKKAILLMKDGLYDEINGYKIVAAYCLNLIGSDRGASKMSWPKGACISHTVYRYVIENPTGANTTIERCEALFRLLMYYKPEYTPKASKTSKHRKRHKNISIQGHDVRHMSYSSTSGGFDYGITDT